MTTTATDLAAQLRTIADAIDTLDAAEPLPPLYMSLGVQVAASTPQPDRIRAVVRLNEALGRQGHETQGGASGELLRGVHAFGEPYAFCGLDAPLSVPVLDPASLVDRGVPA